MTKFDEMCKAYELYLNNFDTYQNECTSFAKDMIEKLINYYGIPRQQIKIQKVDEELEADYNPAILGNFVKLELGGFCHVWVKLIVVSHSSIITSQQSILIKFRFKKEANNIILDLNSERASEYPGYKIGLDSDRNFLDFQKVYDFIFDNICHNFENELENFLRGEVQNRVFGYSLNSV